MDALFKAFRLPGYFCGGLLVAFLDSHGQQEFIFFKVCFQGLEAFDLAGNVGSLFQEGGSGLGVFPKPVFGDDFLKGLQTRLFTGDVKDSLRVASI